MGFGNLRVLNDDTIEPGTGFGTHGHRDMEIVSYVLEGALAHQDSLGNGAAGGAHAGVIRPGDVQRMSAGTGVRHSEYNHSTDRATHFLQIWLLPDRLGIAPEYEQITVDAERKRGRLALVASSVPTEGAVALNADARLWAGLFDGDERAQADLPRDRLAYVHVARGSVTVNGLALGPGDAVKLVGEPRLTIEKGLDAEVLVFDLQP
jgi:redox-sensitive bicupin YhaK (pirin superfamily)